MNTPQGTVCGGNYLQGFGCATAAHSLCLSEKYKKCLRSIEKGLKVTSTPKVNIMNVSFTKCFGVVFQGDSSSLAVDNDSGYVSTNPESNLDYPSLNNMSREKESNIYLSEDALLEKPEICQKDDEEEYPEYAHLYYLSNSIVAPSCESEKTTFSGFNDDDSSVEKDTSNESLVVSLISPLCVSTNTEQVSVETTTNAAICQKDEEEEYPEYAHLYYLSNAIVAPSCESETTTFSDANAKNDTLVNAKQVNTETTTETVTKQLNVVDNVCDITTSDYFVAKTPEKQYKNPITSDISPDLFSDDDEPVKVLETSQTLTEKYVHAKDQKLIKRVQQGLSGVFPPPSVTYFCMSVTEMLDRINENQHLFADARGQCEKKSLLVTEVSKDDIKEWPHVLEQRYHGLHYNRSKLSEEFEQLCTKYGQRYIGCETNSSCTIFENTMISPSKRKSTKLRWNTKSPGRRLSHLARRRITFTNPAIQNSGTSSSVVCSRARQILVDARRLELLSRKKSPRKTSPRVRVPSPRKTPRKSPRVKGRTPSSSTKKRLALQFRMYSEDERPVASTSSSTSSSSSFKRALFQSPEKESATLPNACIAGLSFSTSTFSKKITPKRALFTSPKKSSPSKAGSSSSIFDRKRKRTDEEDSQQSKLLRSVSGGVNSSSSEVQKPLAQRRISECSSTSSSRSCELSAHHKKKLQWAVYEALKLKSIGVTHPQFKTFASTLARVTRRFLPNLSANVPRPEGGTSDKMLRIARQYVHAVVNGKSVDEIVLEVEVNRKKNQKPVGYVSMEASTSRMDVSHAKNDKENVSQKKVGVLCERNTDENVAKVKHLRSENKIDRIRKVIDFGDDNEGGMMR